MFGLEVGSVVSSVGVCVGVGVGNIVNSEVVPSEVVEIAGESAEVPGSPGVVSWLRNGPGNGTLLVEVIGRGWSSVMAGDGAEDSDSIDPGVEDVAETVG